MPLQPRTPTSPSPASFHPIWDFLREGRRRKVWTTAAAYVAISLALLQLVDAVASALLFPDWTLRLVTFLLILGFPFAVVFAWIFDIGPGGSLTRTGAEEAAAAARPAGHGIAASASAPAPPTASTARRRDARPLPSAPAPRTHAPSAQAEPHGSAPADPDRVRRAALAHVRHELRTPINAILGYSELILEEDPGPAMEGDLRRINAAGATLLGLVDRILNPAQLAGAIERDLESYAEEVRAGLRTPVNSVIGYAELLIESEREAGRGAFLADLERIRAAAGTLLAHSENIVSVALAAPGSARTSGEGGDAVEVSVRLAEGVLAGIGPSPSGHARGPHGEGTLLVVDDNPTSRDLLSRQLAGHGYIVDTAENGAEALERVRGGRFDLILLDVIMPVMDGVETLRRLKADEALRDIPVVMLSSLDETEGALRCLELGSEEYLAKPVPSRLLEARIEANLLHRRLREHSRLLQERLQEDEALIERLLGEAFPPAAAARVASGGVYREALPQAAVLVCRVDPRDAPAGTATSADQLARLAELCAAGEREAAARGMEAHAAHRDAFVVAVAGNPDAPGDPVALEGLALALLGASGPGAGGRSAWPIRAALHLGPAVAGVVGARRPRFDIWGEAVETAGMLAAQAEPGSALVSPTAQPLLNGSATLEPVGVTEVPGRGRMRLHVLRPPAA